MLAPAARWRSLVVPVKEEAGGCGHAPHARWIPWAELMKRTFGVDALRCPRCEGRLRVRAVVRGAWKAPKLLGVIGLPAEQAVLLPARGPPEEEAWC